MQNVSYFQMDLRAFRCIGAAKRARVIIFWYVATPMELDFVDAFSRGFALSTLGKLHGPKSRRGTRDSVFP